MSEYTTAGPQPSENPQVVVDTETPYEVARVDMVESGTQEHHAPQPVISLQAAQQPQPVQTMDEVAAVSSENSAPQSTHAAQVHLQAHFGQVVEHALQEIASNPEGISHDLEHEVLQDQGYFQSAA